MLFSKLFTLSNFRLVKDVGRLHHDFLHAYKKSQEIAKCLAILTDFPLYKKPNECALFDFLD